MTIRVNCVTGIRLPRRRLAAFLCGFVFAASSLAADEATRFVKELHGIQPGRSTLDDLQAKPKWGAPAAIRPLDPLTMELSYAIPPWRSVLVVVRGDVVRAIDLLPPGQFEPHELVEPFDLGRLTSIPQLPPGADLPVSDVPQVTYQVAEKAYVVVLVQTVGNRSIVERVRLFTPGSGPDLLLPGEDALDLQPLAGPTDTMRLAVRTAAAVIPQQHITRHPLDGEIGKRAWGQYLELLDPWKLVLTRADVDSWESPARQIDDELKRGELTRFWDAAGLARQRVLERIRLIAGLLREPIDFEQDEVYRRNEAQDAYVLTEADLRERWRKQIKFHLLVHRSTGADEYESRLRVWRSLQADMSFLVDLDDDGVLQAVVQALARAYDSASSYVSAKTQAASLADLQGKLVGIGANLKNQNGYVTVVFTMEGSPAEQAGLQPGDRFLSVAQGEEGLWRNAVGEPLSKVVQRIRGAEGTVVQLRVLSPGAATSRVVRLVRAPIQVTPMQGAVLATPTLGDGRTEKIGYIQLPRFYRTDALGGDNANPASSSRDVRQVLNSFTAQQVDAVLLDLRSNSGGVLAEVDALAELFNGPGPVRQWRLADGKTGVHNTSTAAVWTGPLVVLTDGDTGSGGEMLVAALADRNRALLVGASQTAGNGTIRNVHRLEQLLKTTSPTPPPLGSLYLTEVLAYRINGEAVQQAGVRPHVILPPPRPTLAALNSQRAGDLPFALKFDRIAPAAEKPADAYAVSSELRRWLQQRTNERQANSPQFREAAETWMKLAVGDQGNVVPLHEEEFRIWYGSFNAPVQVEILPGTRNVLFDHHLRETLTITLDYLERLHGS